MISVSAVSAVYLLLLAGLPLLAPACLFADLVRARLRFPVFRFYCFLLFMLAWECFGVAAAFGLWLLHAASAFQLHAAYIRANYRLQWFWGASLARVSVWLFRLQLEVEHAADILPGGAFYFFRHTSFADTILPVYFISQPHGLRLRYVLKRELLWDPCLDIVGQRLPNRFVARDGSDVEALDAVGQLAGGMGPQDGVLIFPEGTRFSPSKRENLLRKMRADPSDWRLPYAERWRQVLPPKLGGPLALLRHAPEADVVFCAHTGLEAASSVRSVLNGGLIGARIRIRFWRIPAAEVPAREEDRARWLFEQWNEVNAFAEASAARTSEESKA